MTTKILKGKPCAGFSVFNDTIQIEYNIESGVQKPYHVNPGKPYVGLLKREAYLPKTKNYYGLLKRLQAAFMRGMTFTIGTSISAGLDDSLKWSSIPHKTSRSKSHAFSFPSDTYLSDCHCNLDMLGIPKAHVPP
eukprot:CAMPEP_0202455218 /NCGR_PEP_ID=MMETSP1360-20130828/12804_1 /ASSEMBLY_ACC=CAM_ASM_000848 /TAXON_ID=515479 /ORGANISM="Licmophora paradoxa, Strain CCMP2313" /LENGTH=134 /DNA_ID=CAMNT_0049074751 /DNA_START=550 /DNA_END=954 /DNA_ORIENTATION=-